MKRDLQHLIIFFTATLAWTWAFYFPIGLFHLDWSSGMGLVLFLAGGPAPSLMGLLMVFTTFNSRQKRDYFIRCVDFRRMGRRLLFPVLLFTILMVSGVALDIALGGTLPGMAVLKTLAANPLTLPAAFFLYLWSGPLNEEFGWRGYALEPLLANFGFVRGSVILGVVWGLWHLPWCFMPGQAQQLDTFWLYILSLMGLSMVISLIYVKTQRSILAAILMHFSSNLLMSQLLTPTSAQYEIWRMVLLCFAGCLIAGYAIKNRKALMEEFETVYASVNVERIGVMGHSLGGSAALAIPRQRDDIAAVIALESPFLYDIVGVENDEFIWLDEDYPAPVLNIYSDSSWNNLSQWAQYERNNAFLSNPQKLSST